MARSIWMPVLPRRKRLCSACSKRCRSIREMEAIGKDPKTELQEWLQGRSMKLPAYRVVATLGAAHKQSFDVECEIPELNLCRTRHWRLASCRRAGGRDGHVANSQSDGELMNTPRKQLPTVPAAEVQDNLEDLLAGMRRDMRPAGAAEAPVAGQRCGLIAIVGKPNVGKSTLLNALVGQKISITSRKAQTTRHRITGMHTVGATQFVFVDTPGFQTLHGNALNKSLNKTVVGAVADVDLILFVVEAGSFTPADARVLALLGKNIPTLLIANKLDNVHRRGDIAPWLQDMQDKHAFAEFVPMSAKNAKDIERLLGICEKYLPEQAWWYAADELTDRSEKFHGQRDGARKAVSPDRRRTALHLDRRHRQV